MFMTIRVGNLMQIRGSFHKANWSGRSLTATYMGFSCDRFLRNCSIRIRTGLHFEVLGLQLGCFDGWSFIGGVLLFKQRLVLCL